MDKSTIYFPVTCPCCGQEYLVASNRNTIETALAGEHRLTLSSCCAHHRVTWVANEIERHQIREYAETIHFSWNQRPRQRRYLDLASIPSCASPREFRHEF
jgi:hypothetical protein